MDDLVRQRKQSVLLERKELKKIEKKYEDYIIKADKARLCENYETVIMEKKQIDGVMQMERFAKRIVQLQKSVSEKAIDLTNAQKSRDELQTRVNELNEKNAKTVSILNQLIAIHARLRPHDQKSAFAVDTFARKEREREKAHELALEEERHRNEVLLENAMAGIEINVGEVQ